MRPEIGFRIGLLVLFRQHHNALAVTFEAEQHKGLRESVGERLLTGLDLCLATAENSFLTFHMFLYYTHFRKTPDDSIKRNGAAGGF